MNENNIKAVWGSCRLLWLLLYRFFLDIMFAYYSANDPESVVTSYEAAWGTKPGFTDVKEFEEVGNTTVWFAKKHRQRARNGGKRIMLLYVRLMRLAYCQNHCHLMELWWEKPNSVLTTRVQAHSFLIL